MEIFRKYLWYLLRERKFDQEAADDLVYLKSALNLTDDQVRLTEVDRQMKWGRGGGVRPHTCKWQCDARKVFCMATATITMCGYLPVVICAGKHFVWQWGRDHMISLSCCGGAMTT